LFVGTSPPARPAKSTATASECPVPNAWRRPPARSAVTMWSAAWLTLPAWVTAIRSMTDWIALT
jgi:hypothetical protein